MVSMTIRNIPEAARDRHAERADRAGQSLQEYMRTLIVDTASALTTDEWLDSLPVRADRSGSTITTEEIVRLIREDRDGR